MMNDEGDNMAAEDDARALTQAVNNLTRVVTSLDELLRRDYPKRAEIERRFVSKQASRRLIAQTVVISILVVLGINALTLTAYSRCFGQPSGIPTPCHILPGAGERQERSKQLNDTDRINELRIARLERELGLRPFPEENPEGEEVPE